jgi:O-acetyl-ADP-ribose deacetylase (regulator of RNase III)
LTSISEEVTGACNHRAILRDVRIEAVHGDITAQDVDAVVNAANTALAGGGGVDGAIHRATGPDLARACRELGGCPTGDVRVTPGFRLRARWVIHAVGPVYRGGHDGEHELLASCYRRALEVAAGLGAASMAFPAISTGIYGFPREEACPIAVESVRGSAWRVEEVRLVAFDDQTAAIYRRLLEA